MIAIGSKWWDRSHGEFVIIKENTSIGSKYLVRGKKSRIKFGVGVSSLSKKKV